MHYYYTHIEANRQTDVAERITTRHTDVIECITNIDTQTWSNALHVLILSFYVAGKKMKWPGDLILLFYVHDVLVLSTTSYYATSAYRRKWSIPRPSKYTRMRFRLQRNRSTKIMYHLLTQRKMSHTF